MSNLREKIVDILRSPNNKNRHPYRSIAENMRQEKADAILELLAANGYIPTVGIDTPQSKPTNPFVCTDDYHIYLSDSNGRKPRCRCGKMPEPQANSDTPQDSPLAPTEGVEPVSEVDKLIESCIAVGLRDLTSGNESTMYLPALRAAIERLIAEARIEERELMSKTFFEADRDELPIERIYAIHLDRLAQLNQMKGKTV